MAEMLFRRLAAEKLVCRDWELRERGIDVFSAGIAAHDSLPASPEAVQVMKECGIDMSEHLSQQITSNMLEQSTMVLALTERHRRALIEARPDLSERIMLLSRTGEDIQDPIGGSLSDYQECAAQISENLRYWVEELLKKDA